MTREFMMAGHLFQGTDPVCCEKCPCKRDYDKRSQAKKWRVLADDAIYEPTEEPNPIVLGFYRWKLVAWLVAKMFLRKHTMGEVWIQRRIELAPARLLR